MRATRNGHRAHRCNEKNVHPLIIVIIQNSSGRNTGYVTTLRHLRTATLEECPRVILIFVVSVLHKNGYRHLISGQSKAYLVSHCWLAIIHNSANGCDCDAQTVFDGRPETGFSWVLICAIVSFQRCSVSHSPFSGAICNRLRKRFPAISTHSFTFHCGFGYWRYIFNFPAPLLWRWNASEMKKIYTKNTNKTVPTEITIQPRERSDVNTHA